MDPHPDPYQNFLGNRNTASEGQVWGGGGGKVKTIRRSVVFSDLAFEK